MKNFSIASNALALTLFMLSPVALAQFRPVDPRLTYERVLAIVPMVGSGRADDPKRPMFSDSPKLIGYHAELSDNGQFALVEFVARTREELAVINSSRDARVQTFKKSDAKRSDVLREFQKLKAKFNPDNFGLAVR